MNLSKEDIKDLFERDELTGYVLRIVQHDARGKCYRCYCEKRRFCLHDPMTNDMMWHIVNTKLDVLDHKMRNESR